MEHKSDFLVLGGGIIGCSVAYFLSKTSASVTVLERGDTAFGTAGASGGLINWITCGETQMELFMRSQDMLEHLQEELGADFELNYNSYNMQIISNQIEWDASAQLVNDFKLPGFEAKLIDSYESHLLEPCVTEDMLGSIYVPRVHYLNPIKFALAYRNAAVKHGAKFVNGAEVKEILHEVKHFCNTTISSAQYQTIVQHPELFPAAAIKYNLGFSVEQTSTGACIIHGTREMNSGLDNGVIPEVIELLIQTACKFIPKLGTLRIMRTYAGVRPGTPDGDPYIGLVSGVPGFCECCGHGGEGIALSPATGEAIAELLIDGHTKHCDISRFSPDRVGKA